MDGARDRAVAGAFRSTAVRKRAPPHAHLRFSAGDYLEAALDQVGSHV
jgi:hypothetical protein